MTDICGYRRHQARAWQTSSLCCSEGFCERAVMNNYFGIGIDAKISLDFHQKREEHPEKCRSRAKNYMWYSVLGSKEWLQVRSQYPCGRWRISYVLPEFVAKLDVTRYQYTVMYLYFANFVSSMPVCWTGRGKCTLDKVVPLHAMKRYSCSH